jgi:hypothetical protein
MADRQIETLPGAPAIPSVEAAANQPPAPSVPLSAESTVVIEEVGPRETGLSAVASDIAGRASYAAHYVQEHYLRETVTGLGRIIRRYPAPSLGGAAVAGFMVGRALRRR